MLEVTLRKITTVGKGKRYDKAVGQAERFLEDMDDMQAIVGKDKSLADRLESMKLRLSGT